MNKLIAVSGNLAGAAGILICLLAGASRLAQNWYVAGFQVMILFDVGVGLMVLACLAKLHLLRK